MPKKIVIEGDVVRVVNETVERECSVTELMINLSKDQPVGSPVLPKGCFKYETSGEGNNYKALYYIFQNATMQPIKYIDLGSSEIRDHIEEGNDDDLDEERYDLNLSLPPLVIVVMVAGTAQVITKVYMYTVKGYPTSEDTPLHRVPLPNIDSNGWVCLGDIEVDGSRNINERIFIVLDKIFNGSNWNNDITPDYSEMFTTGNIQSIHDYNTKSQEDNTLWTRFNWRQTKQLHQLTQMLVQS